MLVHACRLSCVCGRGRLHQMSPRGPVKSCTFMSCFSELHLRCPFLHSWLKQNKTQKILKRKKQCSTNYHYRSGDCFFFPQTVCSVFWTPLRTCLGTTKTRSLIRPAPRRHPAVSLSPPPLHLALPHPLLCSRSAGAWCKSGAFSPSALSSSLSHTVIKQDKAATHGEGVARMQIMAQTYISSQIKRQPVWFSGS